jgi:N-methylhydantoinase B
MTIEKGDKLKILTPGGGGYGDPLTRPYNLVVEDVLSGLVTLESAKRDYGVIIDPTTNSVNQDASKKMRGIK